MTGTSSKGRRDYRVEGHGATTSLSIVASGFQVLIAGDFTSPSLSERLDMNDSDATVSLTETISFS